jgi:hypothetical protein
MGRTKRPPSKVKPSLKDIEVAVAQIRSERTEVRISRRLERDERGKRSRR